MDAVHVDLTDRIPPFLLKAAKYIEKYLEQNGYECYLVGGSVRDLLLKRKISDLDFTTNALPTELKNIFPRTIPVGEKFGTILVLFHHLPIEVTTYRNEGQYLDGRRPDSVSFGDSLYEDVIRRDFTINGMAYQVSQKLLIDYVGGREDINSGIIRTIGDPRERFREDGLRPIRGCRIMANLGFSLELNTRQAMSENLDIISRIAPERFYDEWKKTLKLKNKHVYWDTLKQTGIFQIFFPEFTGLIHDTNRWNNLLDSIQHSMPRNMAIYSAHFFYQEFSIEPYFHIENTIELKNLLKDFFQRNRFPLKTQKLCANLLQTPLLRAFDEFETIPDLLVLKKALSKIELADWFFHLRFTKEILYRHYSKAGRLNIFKEIMITIIRTIRDYRQGKFILFLSELSINGDFLIQRGMHGKHIGNILHQTLSYVIENPAKNNQADLEIFIDTLAI